jgi:hypothetical protein
VGGFFTGSEEITALQTSVTRVKTGQWPLADGGVVRVLIDSQPGLA